MRTASARDGRRFPFFNIDTIDFATPNFSATLSAPNRSTNRSKSFTMSE